MGFTLNMLTMLALTLSVGIVIDDAIVVLENIYRFIEEKHEDKFKAAADATAGNRPGGAGHDAVARRDLRPGRLHGRHRRPLHEELRPDDGVRDPRVAGGQLHADAHAVGTMAEGRRTRQGQALVEGLAGLPRGRRVLHAAAGVGDAPPRASSPSPRCWCCCRAFRCSWWFRRTSCRRTTSRSSRSACARRKARASRRPKS